MERARGIGQWASTRQLHFVWRLPNRGGGHGIHGRASPVAHGSSRSPMAGEAHNSCKRCSTAQRALLFSAGADYGWSCSLQSRRACCMHAQHSAIWARVMLISLLGFCLALSQAIPRLAAYEVSIGRGARRTACQYDLARLQTERRFDTKPLCQGFNVRKCV